MNCYFFQIKGVLAAVDTTEETELGKRFDIKGFPTIKYFKNGSFAFDAGHAREVTKIITFMENPTEPPPPPPPEKPWAEEESEVVHLEKSNFKEVLKKKKHVLVAFYAPCKYCHFLFISHQSPMAINCKILWVTINH